MEEKFARFLVLFLLSFQVLAAFSEKHFTCLEGSPANGYIHFFFHVVIFYNEESVPLMNSFLNRVH